MVLSYVQLTAAEQKGEVVKQLNELRSERGKHFDYSPFSGVELESMSIGIFQKVEVLLLLAMILLGPTWSSVLQWTACAPWPPIT